MTLAGGQQMSWRICAVAVLTVPLFACSTYNSVFSGETPKQAQAVEREEAHDARADQDCVRVARERADDAVMALYVSDGSPEQQEIYQATYRDCLDWHGH